MDAVNGTPGDRRGRFPRPRTDRKTLWMETPPTAFFLIIVPQLPQSVHTLVGISSRGYRPSATMR